jgi:hypothetical protein
LTTFTISNKKTVYLGDYLFEKCTNLTTIKFTENMEWFGDGEIPPVLPSITSTTFAGNNAIIEVPSRWRSLIEKVDSSGLPVYPNWYMLGDRISYE